MNVITRLFRRPAPAPRVPNMALLGGLPRAVQLHILLVESGMSDEQAYAALPPDLQAEWDECSRTLAENMAAFNAGLPTVQEFADALVKLGSALSF